ncbi:MAG: ThiF family adenylyltransferase [Anaerolineales bacterium]|nr:ThiF family adenylyltransferase [Anaerolineales bacterium]
MVTEVNKTNKSDEDLTPSYEKLFQRNYGVLNPEQQNRIRETKVVIVGCGGIGGVIAMALARSGLEKFVLYDGDVFHPSNINRQLECFFNTFGENKARATHKALLKVNPEIQAEVYEYYLKPQDIDKAISQGDIILPVADEWPLSIHMLDRAIDLGKPAILSYPVGALARVSTFLPGGPYSSECLVMPYRANYQTLKEFMEDPANRQILFYYKSAGAWRDKWFKKWCQGQRPHAQLCGPVWIAGTLAAMEVIKLATGKWKPVTAPRHWYITPTEARIKKFSLARRLLSRSTQYPWGKELLVALADRPWLVKLFTRAIG